jgi:hypothetical protein
VEQFDGTLHGRHGSGVLGHLLPLCGCQENHLVDIAMPDLWHEFDCGLGFLAIGHENSHGDHNP